MVALLQPGLRGPHGMMTGASLSKTARPASTPCRTPLKPSLPPSRASCPGRAAPGAGARGRGCRNALGTRAELWTGCGRRQEVLGGVRPGWRAKRPFEFPSMLPLLSSPLGYFFLPFHSLGAVSHGPDRSGGFLWRWDLASPTTFSPCGLHTPVTRCSLRLSTRAGRPVGGDPSYPTAFCKARKCNGPPPPAPGPRPEAAPQDRLRLFACCPLWYVPGLRHRQSAMSH